jgi:hypothetical protein
VSGVRAAVEEVNRVDAVHGDEVRARQRWAPMPAQIESALTRSAYGPDALAVYAVPIDLVQTLLGQIGSTSGVLRDTDLVAYHLIEGALVRVPDVIVNAGRIVALVRSSRVEIGAIAIAQDRITDAATSLGGGLQLAADGGSTALVQLTLVDTFTAAALAMSKAAARPNLAAPAALADLDAARQQLQKAAVTLTAALLSGFDSLLDSRAAAVERQRLPILIGAALVPLAAAGLMWTCLVVLRRRPTGRGVDATLPRAELSDDGTPYAAVDEGGLVAAHADAAGPEARRGRGARPS